MEKLHIKRDDTVVVISGDSKGTRGKVIAASPEEKKVILPALRLSFWRHPTNQPSPHPNQPSPAGWQTWILYRLTVKTVLSFS